MDKKNKTKEKASKKWKLLGKKSEENELFNLVSCLINNNSKFIKSTLFELEFITNSEISSINELKYYLTLKNNSFNKEKESLNNLLRNKEHTLTGIQDEYYDQKNFFKKINIELVPSFNKNIYLDFSSFPLYYYDNEKKAIKKYNSSSKKEYNKFTLCIYLSQLNTNNLNAIKDLNKIDNIFDYFKYIYIISEVTNKEEIIKIIKNNNNIDNLGNGNIKCLFYLLYSTDENIKSTYNIFKENNKFYPEYYFILDENNKIIKIKKNLENLVAKINGFKFNLEKLKKENKNYNDELLIKRKNKKQDNYKLYKELIIFILNLKNSNYLFNFIFNISFNATINEECSDIFLKEINYIDLRGTLRSNDIKYVNNLLNLIKSKNKNKAIKYKFEELETIDIDIDFTNMKCFKCLKLIPEDKHLYYCYICKTKFCYECVHEQLKKTGKEKYIDQKHNLLFFKTRNKKDFMCLDKPKLGRNRFAESSGNNGLSNRHSAICNGCRNGFPNMARYVCIHCRPGKYLSGGYIDYCQICIEKMCSDNMKKRELEEKANEEININSDNFTRNHILSTRHLHDQHIYLLLPMEYEGEGYPYKDY